MPHLFLLIIILLLSCSSSEFLELLRQFQSLLHGLHLVVETEGTRLLHLPEGVLITEISQYSFGLGSILERSF